MGPATRSRASRIWLTASGGMASSAVRASASSSATRSTCSPEVAISSTRPGMSATSGSAASASRRSTTRSARPSPIWPASTRDVPASHQGVGGLDLGRSGGDATGQAHQGISRQQLLDGRQPLLQRIELRADVVDGGTLEVSSVQRAHVIGESRRGLANAADVVHDAQVVKTRGGKTDDGADQQDQGKNAPEPAASPGCRGRRRRRGAIRRHRDRHGCGRPGWDGWQRAKAWRRSGQTRWRLGRSGRAVSRPSAAGAARHERQARRRRLTSQEVITLPSLAYGRGRAGRRPRAPWVSPAHPCSAP